MSTSRAQAPGRSPSLPGMCCFVLILGLLGPRLAFLWAWIFTPRVDEAFGGSFWWPLLGVLLLPWTALAYVAAWATGQGVTGELDGQQYRIGRPAFAAGLAGTPVPEVLQQAEQGGGTVIALASSAGVTRAVMPRLTLGGGASKRMRAA